MACTPHISDVLISSRTPSPPHPFLKTESTHPPPIQTSLPQFHTSTDPSATTPVHTSTVPTLTLPPSTRPPLPLPKYIFLTRHPSPLPSITSLHPCTPSSSPSHPTSPKSTPLTRAHPPHPAYPSPPIHRTPSPGLNPIRKYSCASRYEHGGRCCRCCCWRCWNGWTCSAESGSGSASA